MAKKTKKPTKRSKKQMMANFKDDDIEEETNPIKTMNRIKESISEQEKNQGVSNVPMEVEESSEEEEEEDKPKLSKEEKFVEAFNEVMNTKLSKKHTEYPILCKYKIRKQYEKNKVQKSQKDLHFKRVERDFLKYKGYISAKESDLEYEDSLRNIATKGVTQLFNAISTARAEQKKREENAKKQEEEEEEENDVEDIYTRSSKEKFLQMLQDYKQEQVEE